MLRLTGIGTALPPNGEAALTEVGVEVAKGPVRQCSEGPGSSRWEAGIRSRDGSAFMVSGGAAGVVGF